MVKKMNINALAKMCVCVNALSGNYKYLKRELGNNTEWELRSSLSDPDPNYIFVRRCSVGAYAVAGVAPMSLLKLKAVSTPTDDNNAHDTLKKNIIDLGNASEVIYIQRFTPLDQSWNWFDYLDKHIPWTRPTIHVFGKSIVQPRDTCYVATPGLTQLTYSGYQPHAYSWDDYPPLKDILEAVHKALPGSTFNSLLINRYKGGNDYVGWHADDEKLYGPTPEIASVSFGCDREFILKKKPNKRSNDGNGSEEPAKKRLKKNNHADKHSFTLKHGSLLVMRGYTQRDWHHSVPKRAKAEATRINLTFRRVL